MSRILNIYSVCLLVGTAIVNTASVYLKVSDWTNPITTTTHSPKPESVCGTWIPYRDEKCVKIAETAGFQTQEDAEGTCRSLDFYEATIPPPQEGDGNIQKLVTVKTKEEQAFLQKFLFTEGKTFDTVWLGLTEIEVNETFEWNDGGKLYFTNWAEQDIRDKNRRCVQMESGTGTYATGLWTKVTCKKRNVVVCEKTQTWTLDRLQTQFFNLNLRIRQLEQQNQVPVSIPVGFIYIQLAGQEPPTSLWPKTNWENVSKKYEGLFFRVEGASAAPFGQVQEDQTRHLAKTMPVVGIRSNYRDPVTIPENGEWSEMTYSGSDNGSHYSMKFQLSTGEVRPRNQAIRVWQRK